MSAKLKPAARQVIVITGASSGIGVARAITAAKRGAPGGSVLLQRAAGRIVGRIRAHRGTAMHVVTDVSRREDHQDLAHETFKALGGSTPG